jgi:hypothetical protein
MSITRNVGFGADVGPKCPTCGWMMLVTRRTPHPVHGNKYELQTFRCRTCEGEIERSADRDGLPHEHIRITAQPVFSSIDLWQFPVTESSVTLPPQ